MDDKTHSFIVRVWQEKAGDPLVSDSGYNDNEHEETWRGWVEAVGSGHRFYFQDLQGAIRFIQESIGIKQTNRQNWLRKLFNRLQHE